MAKILLVDDEPELVEVVKVRLEANKYEVITADSGAACLEAARREAPDVILLDLVMPGVDGYEACFKLKRMPETKNIPIILFSASYAKSLEEKVEALGAFDCIRKPFEHTDLLEKIERALKKG
jgi:CheY-like chemotaxis protein